ncbi:VOC family protein [Planctomicrobium sp. SH661]|uniref:VOC family protein n=1 Tax=Planctomicrobium sp. SH661 TaxID=3448124 RepID=UPI003F5BA0C2
MPTQIFVNLPVKDLNRSVKFFTQLGYTFNPQFTDETATCMIIGENIYAMLLTEERFKQFTPKPVSDARKSTEVLVAVSCESREHVKELMEKAMAAGAGHVADPQDYGFMYQHSYEDLDGHIWELFHMDMNAIPS